jgi:hypothetical protein
MIRTFRTDLAQYVYARQDFQSPLWRGDGAMQYYGSREEQWSRVDFQCCLWAGHKTEQRKAKNLRAQVGCEGRTLARMWRLKLISHMAD